MHTPCDLHCNSGVLHKRLIKHRAGATAEPIPSYTGQNESFSPVCVPPVSPNPPENQACGIHTPAILSHPLIATFTVNVDFLWSHSRGTQVIITSKSDYGLRAALYLAAQGNRVRLREISETQHIPESVCAQIMRKLVGAHIVQSQAGPAGGYSLARDPGNISVASVLAAADRDICVFRCVEGGCECDLDGKCAFQVVLRQFGKGIADYLERLSLADLKQGEGALPEFNLPAMVHGKAS